MLSLVLFDSHPPEGAQPILATHDPEIIAAVRRLLVARLRNDALPAPASRQKMLKITRESPHARD